jgi:hypothetical protein
MTFIGFYCNFILYFGTDILKFDEENENTDTMLSAVEIAKSG